jgi:hypothetical protein
MHWGSSKKAGGVLESDTPMPTRTLNVLFLGNSYTRVNNLPATLISIASSDAGNHIALRVHSFVHDSYTLTDMWNDPNAQAMLASERHWDYVILQDQSLWALSPAMIKKSGDALQNFSDAIAPTSGKIVLFETWMREPGSDWYNDPKNAARNPEYMLSQLRYYVNAAAAPIHADVVPVGDCWSLVLKNQPGLKLYQDDGSHPSVEGTYLSALLFYQYLTHRSPDTTDYAPPDTEENAIKAIKSYVPLCQSQIAHP